jgi:hypothetical protein
VQHPPRTAAPGLRLCDWHVDRLGQDVLDVAALYDELALRLNAGTGSGEPVSGTSDTTRLPNPAAVEVRTEIRHVLVSWCRLVAEERGFTLPADEVGAMGAWLKRSLAWLAASEYADEVADEFRDLRGRAWRIAYPSGARSIPMGPCPMPDCPGAVRGLLQPMDARDRARSWLRCDGPDQHEWPPEEWRSYARLAKGRAA